MTWKRGLNICPCLGILSQVLFLDETNNSNFETPMEFCQKGRTSRIWRPRESNEALLPYSGNDLPTPLFVLVILWTHHDWLKKAQFHIWVNRSLFCSVVGALVEKYPFVGKLKHVRGFVGEIHANLWVKLKQKQLSVGNCVIFHFTCG